MIKKLSFLFALYFWLPSPALATPEDCQLSIGVENLDYFPVYAIRDGDYVGAAREIFDRFGRDINCRFTYRPLPIKRLYAELFTGGVDLKFPDNALWMPDAKAGLTLHYSKPVVDYVDGVMVPAGTQGTGQDRIRTLGTVAGFTPFAWLPRIESGQVSLKENPRMDLLLRQVVMGRLDGAYVSVAVAHYLAAQSPQTKGTLAFDPSLPHSRDSYRLSSLTHPEMIERFDAWLAAHADWVDEVKARTGAENGLK